MPYEYFVTICDAQTFFVCLIFFLYIRFRCELFVVNTFVFVYVTKFCLCLHCDTSVIYTPTRDISDVS